LAHNHDPRPVQVARRRRSIGAQHALGRKRRSPEELDAVLAALIDRVARRLRAARRACRTVTLRLRFADFTRATRSHTLARATTQTQAILATARDLLTAAMPMVESEGLTLIGVALSNLDSDGAIQLALPLDGRDANALDSALDNVRDRFGSTAITRATLLGHHEGPTVPLLPD
jgi:DNA polymerase-4